MTKPTGRPRGRPPADAAARIEKLASEGWALHGIAKTLGMDKETLARRLEDHPELRNAFDNGREAERRALHNSLYKAALNGQIAAAMFLLKARHGYREGDQSDQANRLTVEFKLPGALRPDQFTTTVENEPERTAPERLPAPRS
jgi:hypothetical protein